MVDLDGHRIDKLIVTRLPSGHREVVRDRQPACLVLWGRHDAFLAVDEVMAYSRDLDAVEIHVFESGHMLLETHHRQCAALIAHFMHEVQTGGISRLGRALS